MNSYNHYAYGAVAEWIYRYAGGIDTTTAQPGFHVIALHPAFDQRLGSLDLTYQSPYGPIRSTWKATAGAIQWTITIPPNSTGLLALTPEEQSRYKLNGKPLEASTVLTKELGERGREAFTVPAGTFSFTVAEVPLNPPIKQEGES
jgi:alpha-L-rhamnosidase